MEHDRRLSQMADPASPRRILRGTGGRGASCAGCRAAACLDAGARSVGSVVRRARDGRGALGLGVGVTRARLEGVRRAFRPVAAEAAKIGAVVVIPSSD